MVFPCRSTWVSSSDFSSDFALFFPEAKSNFIWHRWDVYRRWDETGSKIVHLEASRVWEDPPVCRAASSFVHQRDKYLHFAFLLIETARAQLNSEQQPILHSSVFFRRKIKRLCNVSSAWLTRSLGKSARIFAAFAVSCHANSRNIFKSRRFWGIFWSTFSEWANDYGDCEFADNSEESEAVKSLESQFQHFVVLFKHVDILRNPHLCPSPRAHPLRLCFVLQQPLFSALRQQPIWNFVQMFRFRIHCLNINLFIWQFLSSSWGSRNKRLKRTISFMQTVFRLGENPCKHTTNNTPVTWLQRLLRALAMKIFAERERRNVLIDSVTRARRAQAAAAWR